MMRSLEGNEIKLDKIDLYCNVGLACSCKACAYNSVGGLPNTEYQPNISSDMELLLLHP